MVASIFVFLATFIALGIGLLGYITFGDKIESLIIYNLPNNDMISILAKISYIITICGSFVLVVQPLFQIMEKSESYMVIPKYFAEKEATKESED